MCADVINQTLKIRIAGLAFMDWIPVFINGENKAIAEPIRRSRQAAHSQVRVAFFQVVNNGFNRGCYAVRFVDDHPCKIFSVQLRHFLECAFGGKHDLMRQAFADTGTVNAAAFA